jgi:hypothetical protein
VDAVIMQPWLCRLEINDEFSKFMKDKLDVLAVDICIDALL